jgi:hypothetical protein
VRPLRSLDVAVELWRPWRQDKELKSSSTASLLELGFELRAAIDLDRFDGNGMRWVRSSRKDAAE